MGMAQSIIQYQHYYFVPWTATLKLIWCIQTLIFLRQPEAHNRSYLKSLPAEKATIALHWVLVACVLSMMPSLGAALLFFLISEFIGGAEVLHSLFS
jgi:hypothetical protein